MTSLYVGNLHPECSEATLYQKFAPQGKIVNIHVCRDIDTGKSLQYGYINFAHAADAEKALITLNYEKVDGRTMRLMWAKKNHHKSNVSANLFVKNFDINIDEKTLYDIFDIYGNILSLKVAKDDHDNSKGFGFVQFEKVESANEAIANLNGKLVRGRKMYVSRFIPKEKSDQFKNIYLKNFKSSFNDQDLKELCEKFGSIVSAKVMMDENGESKGFGFVSFENSESAKTAVKELNGIHVGARRLYVGRAKKKSERQAEILENLKRKIHSNTF